MATEKKTAPRLSTVALADAYAQAAALAKAAEKAAATLRAQVLERVEVLGTDVLIGRTHTVTLSRSLRESLDQKEVRALLTPRQIAAVTRQTVVKTLSCAHNNEVIVGFTAANEEAA